ncbi:hypothetical protein PAB09_07845 [Corynebacterium sp. SCR221107]|uniref:hypothetical protein n=1 Tax=Corynebacterium sp. SCR221107 TaxID=3017361 RepID=UPI0022EC25F5|nr:hypothetical protein [Corynebacterium sp. SCR221107]WBT10145.1 hypothetical protein PAB09_07845 [Corynebacterium sp. SCR221107]
MNLVAGKSAFDKDNFALMQGNPFATMSNTLDLEREAIALVQAVHWLSFTLFAPFFTRFGSTSLFVPTRRQQQSLSKY